MTTKLATLEGINFYARQLQSAQKMRIASGNRLDAIKEGETPPDPLAEEINRKATDIEDLLTGGIKAAVEDHPVWTEWACGVKGVSSLSIGRIMGRCDLVRLTTISKMWAHAGLAPGQRLVKGERANFDVALRPICWWQGTLLRMAGGRYCELYRERKAKMESKWAGRIVVQKKDVDIPEGCIGAKRLDNQSLRWMIKLFMSHLWLVWRKAEGRETRSPWVIEHGHHSGMIEPFQDK